MSGLGPAFDQSGAAWLYRSHPNELGEKCRLIRSALSPFSFRQLSLAMENGNKTINVAGS